MEDRCTFVVGDAEHSGFEDESFDCIFVSSVLHHLDLDAAYKELHRLLRPDGMILCKEALSNNPFFMYYRRKTPHLRTAWEVDHILSVDDIKKGEKYFSQVDIKFFHLFVLGAVPFRGTVLFDPVRKILDGLDSFVLSLPLVRHWAWQGIFTLKK